jgi:hypothetical protein
MPHESKLLDTEEKKLAGDPKDWTARQGFYIYRQHRLIMHGTWFRLVRHGELSQLVRIAVNIPNSLDAMWKITLDKADAQLPSGLRSRLKDIVDGLKIKSVNVFQSRGGKIKSSAGTTQVWAKYVRNGEIRYYINREHPLLADLLESEDEETARAVGAAFGIIEDGFPAISIGEDVSTKRGMMNQSPIDRTTFIEKLDAALPSLLHQADGKFTALADLLKVTEPWASQIGIVQDPGLPIDPRQDHGALRQPGDGAEKVRGCPARPGRPSGDAPAPVKSGCRSTGRPVRGRAAPDRTDAAKPAASHREQPD